ncbi:MAG: hypothetical protein ACHQFZ_06435 [Acidimicrobiales bacterium]
MLGPVMLGFGTIFAAKARADDHWSTSPKITIVAPRTVDASGDPAGPDHDPVRALAAT